MIQLNSDQLISESTQFSSIQFNSAQFSSIQLISAQFSSSQLKLFFTIQLAVRLRPVGPLCLFSSIPTSLAFYQSAVSFPHFRQAQAKLGPNMQPHSFFLYPYLSSMLSVSYIREYLYQPWYFTNFSKFSTL